MTDPSSTLADAAEVALTGWRDTTIAIARQRLAQLLDGHLNAEALTVEHVDLGTFTVVLSDGAVTVAVVDGDEVHGVELVDERWTDVTGPLDLPGLAAWTQDA